MNLTANSLPAPRLHVPTVAFLGFFHVAAIGLAPWFFSWSGLGVAVFLHWLLGGVGICLGYHRLLAHKSFEAPEWLTRLLAVLGSLSLQGGPLFWVGWHRQHHAHTEDEALDPHAPGRGFWWAHVGWTLYTTSKSTSARYARLSRDLARDPFMSWLDRNYLWLQLPLALVLFGLGGWSWVVYGIFVRTVLVWHSTWLVNSATHLFGGYRTVDTPDNTRNLWWVALLTYGEGWHNHHHAYPRAAQTGWKWWELDLTWQTIRLLNFLGAAKNPVLPPAHFLESPRIN